eukprot:GDKH01002911.1.p2 GENE.GDKH01002911.1~~GDKH01002911.1.p2  ORF type:complete len:393 (-),score=151.44 GDKH01002911.1:177-1355(-)
MSDNEHEEGETISDLRSPDVTTKYTTAAEILNNALRAVVDACKDGAVIAEVCKLGDQFLEDRISKVYNKKTKGKSIDKGVAFPTCIAVNEMAGAFSPLVTDCPDLKLKTGDLVKVDLGCHIDGFPVIAGHTLIVGGGNAEGRKADVIKAAHLASEAVLRLVQPGKKNTDVTAAIEKICKDFNCKPLQGFLSHEMKQHVIDGNKSISCAKPSSPEERVEEEEFGVNEVWGIDVAISTGDGKVRATEYKTTVYKRDVTQTYSLKSQLARQFLGEVGRRFPTMPFTIRAIEDEKAMRVGVTECLRHGLIQPFPVTTEKAGEFVAHFKFTLLLLPGGTKKITGLPVDLEAVKSELAVVDEEMVALLASSANSKKKKKKAAKDAAKEDGGAAASSSA